MFLGSAGLDLKMNPVDETDSEVAVPDWLPSDQWQRLLSVSLLPGPLNGLFQTVVDDHRNWKAWFESENPERLRLPLELDGSNGWHLHVLILRILYLSTVHQYIEDENTFYDLLMGYWII